MCVKSSHSALLSIPAKLCERSYGSRQECNGQRGGGLRTTGQFAQLFFLSGSHFKCEELFAAVLRPNRCAFRSLSRSKT